MAGLARWCYRHCFIVIALWIVLLLGTAGASKIIGTGYSNSFSLPSTDSTKALDLLKTVSPTATGSSDTIVWHVNEGSVRDADVKQRAMDMLDKVAHVAQVASVDSPYEPRGALQISKDGKTAYANVSFSVSAQNLNKDNVKQVISTAQAARTSNLQIELGGQDIQVSRQAQASSSEAIGVLAAAIVLFIAFGSLFATLVPLITALMALGVGISSIGLLSKLISVSSFSPTLGALIGLGVGIDYALFVITRHRSNLNAGLLPEESTAKALNTAGRAVLFAGVAVSVALLGLLVLRISFLSGVGIAAAVIVVLSVLAASTLLPALFGVFRMRVLSRKQRRNLRDNGPVTEEITTGLWARNAAFVQRRRGAIIVVSVAVIGVLLIPYFSLRLGSSDAGNDPANTTTRKAYDMLASGFGPGFNGPLQLVGDVSSPDKQAAFARVAETVKTTPGVAEIQAFPLTPESRVGIMQVVPTTSPESKETNDLINNLRDNVLPKAEADSGLHVYVGGITAIFSDFADVINSKLPLFLLIVIGFGFLILMVAFRSLVVPFTAAVMNVLAAGAAFGVVVAVFQYGWGSGILHTGGAGPVEAFLPVMMLAILFGLSMDYQVFLVSRMHEEWVHGKDNKKAVRIGQAETGRVITAAASIMILVFGSFVFGGQRIIAEFGIGLAAAVLIDAFILRNFLVPAIMHVLGRRNWWLPKWLDRALPHLAVEPVEERK
ncbi:MAG TPA: MMPL family transporter [Candidatus Saccharimonadales bacterium]|nr:MMPL family transporter [Candidatus Saccharimonadales bacterium]